MCETISADSVVRLLTELVQCPSVSPGTGPVTGPPFGEERFAGLLADKVAALGGEAQLRLVEPERPNFIGTFAGRDTTRSLMLEAHADTVSVEGMTVEPFAATVRDGKLYGRGSCDTKGSMAAMLLAIEEIVAVDGQVPVTVYLVATCGEEITGSGAKALVAEGFTVDAAIIGEPTDLAVIHASKGSGRFRVETLGKAAHSSTPADGVNAINHMAGVLAAIEDRVAPAFAALTHPVLGSPTISVGTIRGGVQVNIVPDRCIIDVDTRLIPGQSPDDAAAMLRETLEDLARSRGDFQYVLHECPAYPPFSVDPTDPLPALLADACRDAGGRAQFKGAPWASNAGVFDGAGIPTVLFGPGSITQAHTSDEFIEIDQVVQAAKVYAAAIRRYSKAAAS